MSDDGRPPFDEHMAGRLIGAHVIVGLTYEDADGEVERREQLHGEVVRVDMSAGVAIELSGSGEIYWLPPDLRGWRLAPAGEYRLKCTGEVVIDPDYTTTWTVTPPRSE
jgi:hypothetical protein